MGAVPPRIAPPERRLHRLFVTDGGKLVGVITSLDLLRIVEELG